MNTRKVSQLSNIPLEQVDEIMIMQPDIYKKDVIFSLLKTTEIVVPLNIIVTYFLMIENTCIGLHNA